MRWSRSGAFRSERRHLVFLSVLGGLVFFGAGLLGGTASASRISSPQTPSTETLSSVSKVGTVPSAEAGVVKSTSLATSAVLSSEASNKELKVRMYNSYTEYNPIELYPWEHMAEPYKPTTMELLDWPEAGERVEYR